MALLDDLLFEVERRVIIFHKDTTLPNASQLGYTGNPNDANNLSNDGESLLYNCPSGVIYLDKSTTPYISYTKVEDGAGGLQSLSNSDIAEYTDLPVLPVVSTTNIYIDNTGSDTTGLGTIALPYETVEKAMKYVASYTESEHYVYNLMMGTGSYDIINEDYNYLLGRKHNKSINFIGTVSNSGTLSATTDSTKPFTLNISSTTTSNLEGHIIDGLMCGNYDSTENVITVSEAFPANMSGSQVQSIDTTIVLDTNLNNLGLDYFSKTSFNRVKITKSNTNSNDLNFRNTRLILTQIDVSNSSDSDVSINNGTYSYNNYIKTNTSGVGFTIFNTFAKQFIVKNASQTGSGLSTTEIVEELHVINFTYGVVLDNGKSINNFKLEDVLYVKDCTYLFKTPTSNVKIISVTDDPINNIHLDNVSTLFYIDSVYNINGYHIEWSNYNLHGYSNFPNISNVSIKQLVERSININIPNLYTTTSYYDATGISSSIDFNIASAYHNSHLEINIFVVDPTDRSYIYQIKHIVYISHIETNDITLTESTDVIMKSGGILDNVNSEVNLTDDDLVKLTVDDFKSGTFNVSLEVHRLMKNVTI